MKNEKINGGAFKEGLCYIKNYDGIPTDLRSELEPDKIIESDRIGYWREKTHAFLLHKDGTMDLCIYHDISYSNSLRQSAYMIFMQVRAAKGLEPETWYEYPNVRLITLNSCKPYHHSMIGEMLRLPDVGIRQFASQKENVEILGEK